VRDGESQSFCVGDVAYFADCWIDCPWSYLREPWSPLDSSIGSYSLVVVVGVGKKLTVVQFVDLVCPREIHWENAKLISVPADLVGGSAFAASLLSCERYLREARAEVVQWQSFAARMQLDLDRTCLRVDVGAVGWGCVQDCVEQMGDRRLLSVSRDDLGSFVEQTVRETAEANRGREVYSTVQDAVCAYLQWRTIIAAAEVAAFEMQRRKILEGAEQLEAVT